MQYDRSAILRLGVAATFSAAALAANAQQFRLVSQGDLAGDPNEGFFYSWQQIKLDNGLPGVTELKMDSFTDEGLFIGPSSVRPFHFTIDSITNSQRGTLIRGDWIGGPWSTAGMTGESGNGTFTLAVYGTPTAVYGSTSEFEGNMAAPEPTSYAALGIGLIQLAFWRKRKRAASRVRPI